MLGVFLSAIMGSPAHSPTILAQIVSPTSIQQVYQPPPGKPRRQYRRAGGSRGCHHKVTKAITLVVPEDHIPLTLSEHPTFWLYSSQELSLPIRFTLLEPGQKPIYSQEFTLNKSGLIALTLPETVPPLEVGQEYRWSVSIICNRQKPSQNAIAQAWIERVSVPQPKVEEKEELACNLAYARAGLWYDALSCGINGSNKPNSNSLMAQDIFSSLLKEVNLDYIIDSQDFSLSRTIFY